MSHIHVVGAVIIHDGRVLCTQRGPHREQPGKWEFPGGKIEADESARSALIREVREELACDIDVGDEIATTTHRYPFGTIKLTTFYCELTSGRPQLSEHSALVWLLPTELKSLDWASADLPAVHKVVQDLI